MSHDAPSPLRRSAWLPPDLLVEDLRLELDLRERETLVRAVSTAHRNPAAGSGSRPLVVHPGGEDRPSYSSGA